MQKQLYQYLFGNEVLYDIKDTIIDEITTNTVITQSDISPIQNQISENQEIIKEERPIFINQSKVLILVEQMSEGEKELLGKILKAVSLGLDGVDILILKDMESKNFEPVLKQKAIHHFITFGVALQKLKLEILLVPYQIKKLGGINFMYSDSLAIIEQDKAKKIALWNSLKTMFGL